MSDWTCSMCVNTFPRVFQAVPPSRSSCTPPRSPPTVALSLPSIPAACWTETWGESLQSFLLRLLLRCEWKCVCECVSVCQDRSAAHFLLLNVSHKRRWRWSSCWRTACLCPHVSDPSVSSSLQSHPDVSPHIPGARNRVRLPAWLNSAMFQRGH